MRLPVTGRGSVRSMPLLAVAVVMLSVSCLCLGAHQFAVVQPPIPLSVIFGEPVIDEAAARPVRGFFLAEQRSVLHRLGAADRAARIAAHVRPGVRIILLDRARGARLADRV